jgi:hypothetical protein
MDAPFAAESAPAQSAVDTYTESTPSKKARTVADAVANAWTTDQAAVEMGDRFDAWIAEPDSWIDPAPGRREQYI